MFHLNKARRRGCSDSLLDALVCFGEKLCPLSLVGERILNQLVRLFVRHLVVCTGIFLDIGDSLVVQFG